MLVFFSDFQQETWDWTVIIIYNRVSSVDHVVCISRKGNLPLPFSVSSSWSISSISGAVQHQSLPAWTGAAGWRTGLSVTLSARLPYSTELPYSTLLGWSDQQSAAIRGSVHNSRFSTTTRRGRPKWSTLPWSSQPTVNIIIIVYYEALITAQGLPEPSSLRGSTLGTRAAEHKGCNWGMQIDWWLQPRAVFGHTFSGIIWHMPQK